MKFIPVVQGTEVTWDELDDDLFLSDDFIVFMIAGEAIIMSRIQLRPLADSMRFSPGMMHSQHQIGSIWPLPAFSLTLHWPELELGQVLTRVQHIAHVVSFTPDALSLHRVCLSLPNA